MKRSLSVRKAEEVDFDSGSPAEDHYSDGVSSSDDSDGSSEENDDGDHTEEVELSFGTFNMSEEDYLTIKQFLISVFGTGVVECIKGGSVHSVLDLHAMSELICETISEHVGTTAKSEESDDPLAFSTMIPLESDLYSNKQKEAIVEPMVNMLMETMIKSKLSKGQRKRALELMQEQAKCAVVLHERFINLPMDMAHPLLRQLLDDVKMANEEADGFDPDVVILLTRVFKDVNGDLIVPPSDQDHSLDGSSAQHLLVEEGSEDDGGVYQYYYEECAIGEELCELFWDFKIKSVTNDSSGEAKRTFGDRGVDTARRIMLMTRSNFEDFVSRCSLLQ